MNTVEPVARPYVAYRAWLIKHDVLYPAFTNADALWLKSMGRSDEIPWQPEKPSTANCIEVHRARCLDGRMSQMHPHNPAHTPEFSCKCGFYARWKLRDVIEDEGGLFLSTPYVIGAVQCWGRIVLHETGLRAEYARPVAFLENAANMTARIADVYGVPVLDEFELGNIGG